MGSSYQTSEEPYLVTCDDGWFRPVDLKAGPDGALYVADFYEQRISHVDPRDTWDRTTGRIFRVRPADWRPGLPAFDLGVASTEELIKRLQSRNRWERNEARQMLALHQDASAGPALRKLLTADGQPAVEALWALRAIGQLDPTSIVTAMQNAYAPARAWAVRLLGDEKDKPIVPIEDLLQLARREADPQVRSQLASTAKRLPASQALPLIREMLAHDADATDVHIPLLLWWAVEDKAVSHRVETIDTFSNSDLWKHPLGREVVFPRLARRYAAEPTADNQRALVRLLHAAPGEAERAVLMGGIKEGLAGLTLGNLLPELRSAMTASGDKEIALRLGDPDAIAAALRLLGDESQSPSKRAGTIQVLGQSGDARAVPPLLNVAKDSKAVVVRKAAIAALGRFDDPAIGADLVGLCPKLRSNADLRSTLLSVLLSRPNWTADLLKAIDAGSVARADLGVTQIEQIHQSTDRDVIALADKLFGHQPKPTSQEHAAEVARVTRLVTSGAGDAAAGRQTFTQRCAICHTLFGQGAKVGPDLTGYERRNVDFLVISVVDPSAYIREEYTAFRVRTKSGETLIGLITDRGPNQITLQDAAQQKTVIPKDQIVEERALPTSLMPEGLLDGLSDQDVRNLFKYLASEKPPAQ